MVSPKTAQSTPAWCVSVKTSKLGVVFVIFVIMAHITIKHPYKDIHVKLHSPDLINISPELLLSLSLHGLGLIPECVKAQLVNRVF